MAFKPKPTKTSPPIETWDTRVRGEIRSLALYHREEMAAWKRADMDGVRLWQGLYNASIDRLALFREQCQIAAYGSLEQKGKEIEQ